MLVLLVGILHLVVFPGGLFALALGLFLKGEGDMNYAEKIH